jgi:hypothetical protein
MQALHAAKLAVRHMPEVKHRCFVYSSVIAAQRNALRRDSTDFSGYFVCANEIVLASLPSWLFFARPARRWRPLRPLSNFATIRACAGVPVRPDRF